MGKICACVGADQDRHDRKQIQGQDRYHTESVDVLPDAADPAVRLAVSLPKKNHVGPTRKSPGPHPEITWAPRVVYLLMYLQPHRSLLLLLQFLMCNSLVE